MTEYWDVRDAQGVVTGEKRPAGAPFSAGEYHTAIEIWVADTENRLLIQRRALHLPVLPGIWAMTTGRVQAGESAEAGALRELKEELGISAAARELVHLMHIVRDRELIWEIYMLRRDGIMPKPDPDEVAQVRWVTAGELCELYDSGKMFHYPEMKQILDMVINIPS